MIAVDDRRQALLPGLARDSGRRVGARGRVDADGYLFGDDPCAAAPLPRDGAWGFDADRRLDRGRGRGPRHGHQDFLGRAQRLSRQAQAACSYGIRSRGLHQARVSTRANHRLAGSGALRRPHRQRHPWRPARRAHCRSLACGLARRELWLAAIARHDRCGSWTTRRDVADAGLGRQFHHGVLDCGHSGVRVVRGHSVLGERSRSPSRNRGSAPETQGREGDSETTRRPASTQCRAGRCTRTQPAIAWPPCPGRSSAIRSPTVVPVATIVPTGSSSTP